MSFFRVLLLAVGLISLTESVAAQPAPPIVGDRITLNRSLASFEKIPFAGGFLARATVQNPEGAAFRLYFDQIVGGDDTPFELRVIGLDGPIGRISSEELTAGSTYASDLFHGSDITLELAADREPQGLSFRVAELAYALPGGAPFSVTGTDQRLKVLQLASTDMMRERARAVAKLLFRAEDGFDYHCTGFLIAPDRLLTNEHCVGTDFRCSTTLAIFGYLSENAPVEQARCSRLIRVDSNRDMAVIALDRRAGDRWGWLILAETSPPDGRAVYLPQHPDGRTQEISIIDCRIDRALVPGLAPDMDFSHLCDTEGGASGSPVLDAASHEVVGLHHWGFDSPPWHNANRAVKIDRVRELLPQ